MTKLALARKIEALWLRLLVIESPDADALGPVVDALYYGDGEEAVFRCHDGKISDDVTSEILKVYNLPQKKMGDGLTN